MQELDPLGCLSTLTRLAKGSTYWQVKLTGKTLGKAINIMAENTSPPIDEHSSLDLSPIQMFYQFSRRILCFSEQSTHKVCVLCRDSSQGVFFLLNLRDISA